MAEKRKHALFFPSGMLSQIRSEAARLDRSLSWCMQRAWTIAREEIMRSQPDDEPAPPGASDDARVEQALYWPEDMLREMQLEAARQDRSLSWLAQRAWRIAAPRIAALSGAEDVEAE